MTDTRWKELMNNPDGELLQAEMDEGWHWCVEFDGLLVGPGSSEREFCGQSCPVVPDAERRKLIQEAEARCDGSLGMIIGPGMSIGADGQIHLGNC